VIPARLLGRKLTGAHVELLLLEKLEPGVWKCLVKPGKALKRSRGTIRKDFKSSLLNV